MSDSPVYASAAVAAPHALAAEAGRDVLARGGDAIEAMLAMAATIAVVYPHMNGVGGDGFWLIRTPSGKVVGIEACGPAGARATSQRYRDKGYDALPKRGPDACVTVPGAIGGWIAAWEASRALGGRIPLAEILENAIRHAREGYPVSASEARYEPKEYAALKAAPFFTQTFFVDGAVPARGAIRTAPALAETLEQLARAGLNDFYRGDVGRELAADLEAMDCPITREDLTRYAARQREPLTARLSDATLFNFPPPTQGLASLLLLGIAERLDLGEAESFAHIHGLVEASKLAAAIRDMVVTDFDRLTHDPSAFLTDRVFAREAARVDGRRAGPFPAQPVDGDTIWMGAIDGSGLAVSYIQSLFWEYGSGCVSRSTGVLMQNRGTAFSLDPAAKNPLEPGRRPFHTLNPALAVLDDGRVVSYGSMGGDGQPQFQAQVFTRWRRYGMSPLAAIDAPRFLLGRTWGADSASLKFENRVDSALVAELERAGHVVEVSPHARHDGFGHAGLLVRSPRDGRIEASHDTRSDGGAAGL